MKLIEHRRIINKNPQAYETDLESERLVKSIINHIRNDFSNVRFDKQKREILREIVILLFEAQQHRPFFHVEGTELPLCWNRPSDWNIDYIKYEWGHLLSQNQMPEKSSSIENIGLYSARCNQHIQSSMNIQELMVYGGLLAQRISNVLTNRRILFASKKWNNLITSLYD
ncbi:hypothetical protein MED134_15124 [Dokdonia sp. MED134]|uniref:hypothetical protein n=1 Tax=Dokdonia sp. MED134 TaxID=313590 RepID=UPI000068AB22|nr:hypothetical protein [Dokdonia sp. MED134]AIN49902.1 hypothetical protein MED134_15124 [Dokdonia sp. MED134]